MAGPYDAVLIVSFGGPEGPDDVLPFLENVTRGRNIPRERLLEVAEHYQHFGGVSPINEQNRALITSLVAELNAHGPRLPVYWGNRNWHPLLPDALRQMAEDGITRALAFVTSAFGSYSGCRQYLENIAQARADLATETLDLAIPEVDKLRVFYNHPGFIEPTIERVAQALDEIPGDRRGAVPLLFTAHSIPTAMAATCSYEAQLRESCRLVAEALGRDRWQLVYQSRSGPPSQPWLEPDIGDALRALAAEGSAEDVVVAPIGFVSDHIEVLYDLDTEAQEICQQLGLEMVRAGTVGNHPRFVRMIRELIEERTSDDPNRLVVGQQPPWPDVCPADCCRYAPRGPAGTRPGSPPVS